MGICQVGIVLAPVCWITSSIVREGGVKLAMRSEGVTGGISGKPHTIIVRIMQVYEPWIRTDVSKASCIPQFLDHH